MLTFPVNSIPLKDVIISLAKSFEVDYHNNCSEYYVNVPDHIGEGQISGINFENGMGLITYKVIFKEDVRLEFILDEIHPAKFIYSLLGPLSHEFANENKKNSIGEFRCAIVASEKRNGHIIEFEKNILHEVVSVEIDRKEFSVRERCEVESWDSNLKQVLLDIEGEKQFYHVDNCGVYFKDILSKVDEYRDFIIGRKFNLKSITIQMFLNQLVQFDDDSLKAGDRTILRVQELKRVEKASLYIKDNVAADLSVKNLSSQTGLNPNKLQNGFKYLFNTTINEFVTNVRLEQANLLLRNKEYNVRDVVAAVGLESNSYFSKIYKKKYGMTPKNYKKIFS